MQVACVVKFVNRVVLLAPVFSLYLCLDVFGACIACVCMCGRVCTRVCVCTYSVSTRLTVCPWRR